jgi:hypothetical protein
MKTIQERLDHCDREIAQAIEESRRLHTESEHLGILLWEMDWRAEREHILACSSSKTGQDCDNHDHGHKEPSESSTAAGRREPRRVPCTGLRLSTSYTPFRVEGENEEPNATRKHNYKQCAESQGALEAALRITGWAE